MLIAWFIPLLDDEFHRSGADVIDGPRRCHRRLTHPPTHAFGHAGRRRFFQHLLMTPLDRAIPLEQVHVVALRVAEHLDFDVPRPLDIFLDQHGIVAETTGGLALARSQRRGKVVGLVHRAHALAAPARAGFDQHRVTDAIGFLFQQRRVLVAAVIARHQRHAGPLHQLLGFGLQPHRLDRRGRRSDEHQPRLGTGAGEGFVLAQEAVTGVDGLGAGGPGRLDDAFPAQVAVPGRAAADMHGLVAGAHVLGVGVRIGIHGHRPDGHAACGSRHPAGDLAAVGDQNFIEHQVALAAAGAWRKKRLAF